MFLLKNWPVHAILFQKQCGKWTWDQVKQWNQGLIQSIQENQIVHTTSEPAFVDLEQHVDLIILLTGNWYELCNEFGQNVVINLFCVYVLDIVDTWTQLLGFSIYSFNSTPIYTNFLGDGSNRQLKLKLRGFDVPPSYSSFNNGYFLGFFKKKITATHAHEYVTLHCVYLISFTLNTIRLLPLHGWKASSQRG